MEERRWAAFEARVDAELALGRHADLVAELEAAVAEQPLREHLHGQLMLALYRCGRQAEALEAYRRARTTLVEEIGVEPHAELRALQEAILAQDAALDAPPGVADLPAGLDGGSPVLAGRDGELAELVALVADACHGRGGLAFVSGPQGIGKTRLAQELAREALRRRMAVLYTGAADAPAAVSEATGRERATLLIVDDADDADVEVLERAAASSARRRLLVLVLHRGTEPLAVLDGQLPRRLVLGPLGNDAMAEIASLYLPAGSEPLPVDSLAAESGGVPLAVHRVARDWARARASAAIGASAGRAGDERGQLRSAEAELSDDLRRVSSARGARAALQRRGRRGPAGGGLSVPRAGYVRRGPRRVLLRARAVGGRAGRPARGLAVAGRDRTVGQREVVGGSCGAAAGTRRRRAAGIRALAPGADAPGTASHGRARARSRGAGGACGAGGRPVRGGVHGLPRRGRADRVPGLARGAGGGPRPERPGRGRRARRLLRTLRDARSARAAGGREPGAGRPDAARRAAPCDRRAGATGRPAGRAVADRRADRRRARPAGRPAAAVRRPGRAVARARGAGAAPCGVRSHRRRARGGGSVGGADLLGSERAGARRGPGDPAAAGRCRRARGRVRAPPDGARRARSRRAHRGRAGGAGRQPARDGGRRDARGRPRGAAARMAAPARLARGGCRGAAPAPAPDERSRATGRPPDATAGSSTAARGSPRRSTGSPATSGT